MKWIEAKMKELGVLSHPDYVIAFMLDDVAMISVHIEKYNTVEQVREEKFVEDFFFNFELRGNCVLRRKRTLACAYCGRCKAVVCGAAPFLAKESKSRANS